MCLQNFWTCIKRTFSSHWNSSEVHQEFEWRKVKSPEHVVLHRSASHHCLLQSHHLPQAPFWFRNHLGSLRPKFWFNGKSNAVHECTWRGSGSLCLCTLACTGFWINIEWDLTERFLLGDIGCRHCCKIEKSGGLPWRYVRKAFFIQDGSLWEATLMVSSTLSRLSPLSPSTPRPSCSESSFSCMHDLESAAQQPPPLSSSTHWPKSLVWPSHGSQASMSCFSSAQSALPRLSAVSSAWKSAWSSSDTFCKADARSFISQKGLRSSCEDEGKHAISFELDFDFWWLGGTGWIWVRLGLRLPVQELRLPSVSFFTVAGTLCVNASMWGGNLSLNWAGYGPFKVSVHFIKPRIFKW